jgi:hypothetical protein
MFIDKQNKPNIKSYKDMIASIAALSRLSSESSIPYIGYREAENIFCMAFEAENLSRSDCSADAKKHTTGIGVKTFLNVNGKTMQKVAEFNSDSELYRGKTPREIINIIAELRNERLRATKRIHGLDELIYHCVVRAESKIMVFECPMDEVDIKSIKNITTGNKNVINFEDDKNEYSFNQSKSTLYKRFLTTNVLLEVDVKIIDNPYEAIKNIMSQLGGKLKFAPIRLEQDHVLLPLFSDKGGRKVPERSGLNQWNAAGRARDYNEVYVPIPAWIHKKFPDFFPSRDIPFDLRLPNGEILNVKVCQEGGKALMSNPNLALGKWLLRTVMNLAEGELLTYEKLEQLGLDSVVVYKELDGFYTIDFTEVGSYDDFYEENK